jgi:RNA polymerase sigma-70 factor (ECF subfamily)
MSRILEAFLTHRAALKRFLSRFLANAQDVEDIAQETFLRVFANDANVIMPKAYIFRVARNLALTHAAAARKIPTAPLEDFEASDILSDDGAAFMDAGVDARKRLALLAEAIASLPPQCRRVFMLRRVHGVPYKDIAAQMNVSVGTIEKQVAAGLARCVEHLRRHGYEFEDPKGVASESPPKSAWKQKGGGEI